MKIYIFLCRIYEVVLKKRLVALNLFYSFYRFFTVVSLLHEFFKSNNQVLKFVGISEFEFESEDDLLHNFKASTTVTIMVPSLGYKCVQSLVTKKN